jgi:hypothetical protein
MKIQTLVAQQARNYRTAGAVSYNALVNFFQKTPAQIDRHWRWLDFRLNRNYGGFLGRRLGMDGYSVISFILPLLALFFLVAGPIAGRRGYGGSAVFFAAGLVLVFMWRYLARAQKRKPAKWNSVAVLHIGLCLVLILIVWFTSNTATPGVDQRLYRHSFLILGLILYAVMLPIAWLLAEYLFRDEYFHDVHLGAALRRTELFREPIAPGITRGTIARALINAPLIYPLFLFFVPSVVIVFAPPAYRDLLPYWALTALLAAWLLLSFPSFHERIRAVIELMHRCLFVGGQFLVSLAIIVLAIGRLAEFGYIATVVEGSRRSILLYMLCSYTVFWLYEYWMNRVLTERVFRFFRAEQDPIGNVHYPIDPQVINTRVPAENRLLQIHGAARIIAVGGTENKPMFEPYERPAFFDALAANNPQIGPIIEEIKGRMKLYLSSLNILLVVIGISMWWGLTKVKQIPQVTVTATEPKGAVDLRALLFDTAAGGPREHVILLAASGGGTRAALYTASVLHGLAELDELHNIVLASGVSGGGAALAYFAAHQDDLKPRVQNTWKHYYEALSQPFIQEVLEGATEWRINRGLRLGRLLEESFERHLGLTNAPIGQCTNVALIFNTALAGHLWQDSDLEQPFPKWANDHRRLTRSDVAGGRLIFTNLRDKECFPRLDVPGSFRMKYVVVQSSNVSLAAAAALNANFPPVFSNAAVDKDATNRFWVTDGGTTDNRGIDSLLFALRGALREQKELGNPNRFPVIHIVIADASAASIDYQQDRGMGSKFGAPEKFATQLMEELVSEIAELCRQITGTDNLLRLHYLAMPNTLRMRGGLGTHWMLPLTVKLSDAAARDPDAAESVRISGAVVRKLISELHQTNVLYRIKPTAQQEHVANWINNDEHRTNWLTLVRELKERPESKTLILDKRQTR